jgi:uncharacterized membrane protein
MQSPSLEPGAHALPRGQGASGPGVRFDRLDALRGLAIVWMAGFHFAFDLNYFGHIRQNFYTDPFWTLQRTAIVSLFLFCAGLGQAVAWQQGQSWARFWRRWSQVAVCALLVSAGSALMFPRSWIHFGVLHGVAAMLIVVRLLAPLGGRGSAGAMVLVGVAALALLLPQFVAHPVFDSRLLSGIGLVTRKPVTEDYVPVLPWLGVMLLGLVTGQRLLALRPEWLCGPSSSALLPLSTLGRWSLSFYMVHQPVLIGGLLAYAGLRQMLHGA